MNTTTSHLFTSLAIVFVLFSLTILPHFASADVFTFSSSLNAPVLLRAFPVTGSTKLTWQPASSTSPVLYHIYSCRSDEPDFYPIASTTQTQFQTTYPFAGASDAVTRLYEVSAVASDSTESALSDPVMDNDTDGDGIPDSEEALYGTDPNNPDTDGDGLTDGQEVYIYHTNPLNKYTYGDGISDYDHVVNDIIASLPPLAVNDYATSTVSSATSTTADPVIIPVLQNDLGAIATSSLAILTPPSHGTATITTTSTTSPQYGTLTYTPSTGFGSGYDTFTYSIANANGITSNANVSVYVPALFVATSSGATTTPAAPIALDTTSFARASSNVVTLTHTVNAGSASTTDRALVCGTMAHDANGTNVVVTSLTSGSTPFIKLNSYPSAPTATTTPVELWYLLNPAVGNATITLTAPTTAAQTAITCTSFEDFYWYTSGQPFTWIPNTSAATSTSFDSGGTSGGSSATSTTTTPAAPITLDTTTFASATSNTVSLTHIVEQGTASTTDRALVCGTMAHDANGADVVANSLMDGTTALSKLSSYAAAPTSSTTPVELWYLTNPSVGNNTIALTAPAAATSVALTCTSFNDFYWYTSGQPFTWVPNTNMTLIATSSATSTASTPPISYASTSTPITLDATSFVRTMGNTATTSHTISATATSTPYHTLICGTAAQDASGDNIAASSVTYGVSALIKIASYAASATATTTPVELWYLENAPVGTSLVTATASSTASWTAAACTSFSDFYWYLPGQAFTW